MSRLTPFVASLAAAASLVLVGGLVTHLSTSLGSEPSPAASQGASTVGSEPAPAASAATDQAESRSLFEAREREYRARLEEANRRLRDQGAALDEARRRLGDRGATTPARSTGRRIDDDEHEGRPASRRRWYDEDDDAHEHRLASVGRWDHDED